MKNPLANEDTYSLLKLLFINKSLLIQHGISTVISAVISLCYPLALVRTK